MSRALCRGGRGCRPQHECWTWLLCRVSTGIAVLTLMCVTLQCAQVGGHLAALLTLGWLWGSLWSAEAHGERAALRLPWPLCHLPQEWCVPHSWVCCGSHKETWMGGPGPSLPLEAVIQYPWTQASKGKKPSLSSATQVLFCFGAPNSIAAESLTSTAVRSANASAPGPESSGRSQWDQEGGSRIILSQGHVTCPVSSELHSREVPYSVLPVSSVVKCSASFTKHHCSVHVLINKGNRRC